MIVTGKQNYYTLEIFAKNNPVVLERLLQVTRYRGFNVLKMEMKSTKEQQFQIQMKVQGNRPVGTLINQLDKLYEIETSKNLKEDNNNLAITNSVM